jgi:hypothetical protein
LRKDLSRFPRFKVFAWLPYQISSVSDQCTW